MCYSIYISTDSNKDLTCYNNDLIIFKQLLDKPEDSSLNLLSFSNIWFVGSQHDCSCGFRHIMSDELGFSKPVDWYEENEEDIEATKQFYTVIKELKNAGNEVDCLDKWEGTNLKNIKKRIVMLSQVNEEEFRFFENYLFEINE